MTASGQPHLWINQHGERFVDESLTGNGHYVGAAIARQKDRNSYSILDRNIAKHYEEYGVAHVSYMNPDKLKVVDLEGAVKEAIDAGAKTIFMADSLAELAKKMGINPDALQKNVDEYNQFCEKGYDDQFAKNSAYLRPVKEPKFYAFRNALYTYGTMGGIKINGKTEVLDKEFEVISGLYAAGDCTTGELYGDPPFAGLATITFALNTGRIAGKKVLKYIGK